MLTSTKAPLFPSVLDENIIAARVGCAVPPLRVFTLESFGIDRQAFLNFMRPTFSILHLDPYDAKRTKVGLLKSRFPAEAARLDRFLVEYYARREDLDAIIDPSRAYAIEAAACVVQHVHLAVRPFCKRGDGNARVLQNLGMGCAGSVAG